MWQTSESDTRLQGNDRNTWSGCATSEKIASTMPTNIQYLVGYLTSSVMEIKLVLFFAMLTRSLPLMWENSIAYTGQFCKTARVSKLLRQHTTIELIHNLTIVRTMLQQLLETCKPYFLMDQTCSLAAALAVAVIAFCLYFTVALN